MEITQFAALLEQLAVNPPKEAGAPGGWNVDSWCKGFAAEAAVKMSMGAADGFRQDTATGLFEDQLQHVMAMTYDRPYPGNKSRMMMPAASGIPAGAATVAQRGYDITGKPELVVNEGRDIPRVSLQGSESLIPIIGFAVKWRLNYDELLHAAMANVDLDGKGMMAARSIMEREIDLLLALGDTPTGLVGIASQVAKAPAAAGAGVELYTTGAPAAFVSDWDGAATAAQILADFSILFAKYRSENIHEPTDCVLGSGTYSRLETLQAFTGTDKSILDVLKARYPSIQFQSWYRVDAAGVGAVERALLYERGADVCEAVVSLEPINLPPVWDGFGWETVTYARCGGIQAADTTGMVYVDM